MTPICATVLSAWASWLFKTVCTNCEFLTPAKRLSILQTPPWKPSATTRTGPLPNSHVSVAPTRASKARCGTKASCLLTPWTYSQKPAAATSKWTARRPWTGMPCVKRLPRTGCATPTALPLHRLRPSPTSSASMHLLNRALATCR